MAVAGPIFTSFTAVPLYNQIQVVANWVGSTFPLFWDYCTKSCEVQCKERLYVDQCCVCSHLPQCFCVIFCSLIVICVSSSHSLELEAFVSHVGDARSISLSYYWYQEVYAVLQISPTLQMIILMPLNSECMTLPGVRLNNVAMQ